MDTLWIKAALIRAIKTVAQTAVATIGSAAVLSAVDWKIVVSASLLAGVLSILTSIAGLPEVKLAGVQLEDEDDDELDDDEADDILAEYEDVDGLDFDELYEDPDDDEVLPQ